MQDKNSWIAFYCNNTNSFTSSTRTSHGYGRVCVCVVCACDRGGWGVREERERKKCIVFSQTHLRQQCPWDRIDLLARGNQETYIFFFLQNWKYFSSCGNKHKGWKIILIPLGIANSKTFVNISFIRVCARISVYSIYKYIYCFNVVWYSVACLPHEL